MASPAPSTTENNNPSRNPLIVIIGATGTGKSNLALAIAQHLSKDGVYVPTTSTDPVPKSSLKAEVVNADAMQLYKGLPTVTNKLSADEQLGIPHHLLDHISLDVEPWTVNKYVREADATIQEIRNRGRIPIVVGGTGYYAHGLMLNGSILEEQEYSNGSGNNGKDDRQDVNDLRSKFPILGASTPEILAKLREVDPSMAESWHPNDRRKIQRSLEIFLRTGKTASDVYTEQQERKKTSNLAPKTDVGDDLATIENTIRYDPLIFWMEAQDTILKERLNKRVDVMLERGLIDETKEMFKFLHDKVEEGATIDKKKGIWVSIGYKEMEPWLEHVNGPQGNENAKAQAQLRNSCVEAVKAGTRRYAKRQNRYIRIRLANALAEAGVGENLFLLDCSDLSRWDEMVVQPAMAVVDSFLQGKQLPPPQSLSGLAGEILGRMNALRVETSARIAQCCETCDKVLMSQKEYEQHLKSKSHQRVLKARRNREARMARESQSQNEGPHNPS